MADVLSKAANKPRVSSASPFTSLILTFSLLIILFVIAFLIAYSAINKPKPVSSYEECTKSKGSIIRQSYPAVCVSKDNIEFIQPISSEEQELLDSDLNNQDNKEGKFCGGIMGLPCPEGYSCELEGSYPDAGGKCVKN